MQCLPAAVVPACSDEAGTVSMLHLLDPACLNTFFSAVLTCAGEAGVLVAFGLREATSGL